MSDLSDLLRGTADLIDAVRDAYREQRTGFSEREAGDYLDTAGVDGCTCSTPQCPLEAEDLCDEAESSDPDGFVGLTQPGGWCLPAGAVPPPVNLLNEFLESTSDDELAAMADQQVVDAVSHEDLAAHIETLRVDGFRLGGHWPDELASSLLADFRITKK